MCPIGRLTGKKPCPAETIAAFDLQDNPYWPGAVPNWRAPAHEHYVLFLPLALSQTQNDKGRGVWTVFGASEQGPARPFWNSFFSAPGVERSEAESLDFFRRLIRRAYGESEHVLRDLCAAGFRILPQNEVGEFFPKGEPLPSWTAPFPNLAATRICTAKASGELPIIHLQPFKGTASDPKSFPTFLDTWFLDRSASQEQDTFANLRGETRPSLGNFDEILSRESCQNGVSR